MPAIAGGVKRGCGFGEMLADDRVVTDLQITVDELEVGEPDAARVVGRLRGFEGAAVQGNGARLLAKGVSDAAMQPPQRGEQRRRNRITDLIGRAPQNRGGAVGLTL